MSGSAAHTVPSSGNAGTQRAVELPHVATEEPLASFRATLDLAAKHDRLTFLCSFQKEESVILPALLEVKPDVRVVTIDTGVLFPETLATWKAYEERFDVHIDVVDASGPANGEEPWTGVDHCCSAGAKVRALEEALDGCDAWVTGVRREQGPTRANAECVEWDAKRDVMKFNPLAFWGEKDLWRRIYAYSLPYCELHDRGYESIGCSTCTLPGSGRDGRWAGTDKTECGLHV